MRYLTEHLQKDLGRKMVLLGGPRQCGKTTLGKHLADLAGSGAYLNWDDSEHRRAILQRRWLSEQRLLVLDELHKMPRWKGWLKGLYDTTHTQHSYLVTGSARMDVYKRGGDSMFGRYHGWRLHPFSLHEVPSGMTHDEALARLMRVGGFPEPFFDGDDTSARRWRRERFDRVLREDVRDLTSVRDIHLLSLFVDALRHRVGSTVVLSHVAQDLEISPKTAKAWLGLMERMYLGFVVLPLAKNIPRALSKPPKVYFFDNMDVIGDEGARFENLVATHLLKRLQFLEDRDGYRYELRYVRDKEHREVDFVVLKDGVVTELWEAKLSDSDPSKHLVYFAERLQPQWAFQVVRHLKRPYQQGGLRVLSAVQGLSVME